MEKRSESYRKEGFVNETPWEEPSLLSYIKILWEFLFADGERTPRRPLPRVQVDLEHLYRRDPARLSVTWVGHSTLLMHLDGYRIMTDPVLQKRISLLGPTRYNGEAPVDMARIPELDVVVISHNHYDHLNRWTIERLHERVRHFVVPLGVGAHLKTWGVPPEKIVEMDWWEERTIDGLFIACTPAQHFSGRGLFDRDKTLWASFVLRGPAHTVFFGGDSGYFPGFKRIGQAYGPFDMTFLECGAYDERWHPIHMFPEETVQAHLDLRGHVLHPIHWGTFNLALHAWYEPMERLYRAAREKGVPVTLPVVGATTIYPNHLHQAAWWRSEEISPASEAHELQQPAH